MTDQARAPRRELKELAAGLRAHAEWQIETGASALPASIRGPRASSMQATGSPPAARGAPPPSAEPRSGSRGPAPLPLAASPPVDAPAAEEDKKRRLVELASEIRGCQKCGLHAARTQTVFARGNPGAELCFVGEGPGADEDAQGEPFVGKAGQLLDRMIAAMGYLRDDVYVCNIVKCRPPNNRKPEPTEMASCTPYLTEQLALVAPKVIVALGATAVEGLLGAIGGITRIRGQWRLYRGITPVMPTFHPAYLLRNPPAKREVWADLQAVLKQLGRPLPPPAGR